MSFHGYSVIAEDENRFQTTPGYCMLTHEVLLGRSDEIADGGRGDFGIHDDFAFRDSKSSLN